MNTFKAICQGIHNFNNRHNLLKRSSRVLVALSGGADSIALAYCLSKLSRSYGFGIECAIINHGLDNDFAGRSLTLCEDFCRNQDLLLHVRKVNTRALVRTKGLSVEEAARILRYRALSKIALDRGMSTIATAHTLDDQAETVLLRVLRGTSVRGLSAIYPKVLIEGTWVIRPFLRIYRKDIMKMLREQKLKWVEDPSNRNCNFARNRVRRRLIPELKKRYSPNLCEHLEGLASAAYELSTWMDAQFKPQIKRLGLRKLSISRLSIGRESFLRIPLIFRPLALQYILGRLFVIAPALSQEHIESVNRFVAHSSTGQTLALPAMVQMTLASGNRIIFYIPRKSKVLGL